jgi:hypothetical protein
MKAHLVYPLGQPLKDQVVQLLTMLLRSITTETASDVPLVDVVDQPTSSETASGANEPLANVNDLPKPLETCWWGQWRAS